MEKRDTVLIYIDQPKQLFLSYHLKTNGQEDIFVSCSLKALKNFGLERACFEIGQSMILGIETVLNLFSKKTEEELLERGKQNREADETVLTFPEYAFDGFIEDEEGKREISIIIRQPKRDWPDYICEVSCRELFSLDPMPIYGVDAKQAYDLAFKLVCSLLDDTTLYNSSGEIIDFGQLDHGLNVKPFELEKDPYIREVDLSEVAKKGDLLLMTFNSKTQTLQLLSGYHQKSHTCKEEWPLIKLEELGKEKAAGMVGKVILRNLKTTRELFSL